MENELIGSVVGHIGNFGGQLKGNGIANLGGGVVLIVGFVVRNLLIHSREGALNGLLCNTTVFRNIHKDSISTTAIVTSRTALREYKIVTGSQVGESGSALGFIGITRNQCRRGCELYIFGKIILMLITTHPLLRFVSKVN